ncbi:ZYRO0E06336p [Zygosaccharomyces rouxii]|uniref:ZYRO0E06336p n=1 Tax=Zygosaccharomyces rouxii (strain ATCC 2623 / CBS 732 / NBRC 1130 / NCYC 568 / NRRL Y-229) TaxID=559307 RepID=C5E4I2_ZYGRC|nr:uncharacterized protein ZYRO0E06336g [Zygosaccharomyces rouxii]KAH9198199.1 copper fist DNA binding domain-containing protein [Zygosaccharomyces rouxii]CAR30943.1 ZYRO0E06336p [Zygosaccharomyces rouxii]
MIIFDSEKYACASCIRGHRSSTCRHTDRMLVKVRSRGRHASMDIRKVIIVETDSQVTPDESSPSCDKCYSDSKNECEKMNRQPILFLRTRKTQRAILADGNLQIIVENDAKPQDGSDKPHPPFKYISEKDFLRMHLVNEREPSSCGCGKNNKKSKEDITKVEPALETPLPPTAPLVPSADSAFPMENVPQNDFNSKDPFALNADPKQMVELLTHKGLFLSTQCSCEEGHCVCANCLLHRNEEELSSYIQRSGVPLTNMGEAQLSNPMMVGTGSCNCPPEDCECESCPDHPCENMSFNKLLLTGLLNAPLRRKTNIVYKGKLIPSQYWWDFLKLHIPLMGDSQLESLDIIGWFERIVSIYEHQLADANANVASVPQSLFAL